jgi:hypothetical protein
LRLKRRTPATAGRREKDAWSTGSVSLVGCRRCWGPVVVAVSWAGPRHPVVTRPGEVMGRAGLFGVHSRVHKNRFVFVHDLGTEAESTGSWLIAAGRRIYIHCTRLRLYRHISVRLPAGVMVAAERSVGRSILVHTYTDACACGWDVGCCSCLFR